jgi:hypothetical protein
MNNNLVKIDIVNNESFLEACDILHDGYCDLTTVKYDKINGTCKAVFEREFLEDSELMTFEPKLLLFYKVSFPMAKSELSLEGIATFKIEDKDNIQNYSFNECHIKDKTCTFFFNEGMRIILVFKSMPRGSLRDLELLNEKGSFYKFRNPFKTHRAL